MHSLLHRLSTRIKIVALLMIFASPVVRAAGTTSEDEPDHIDHPTEIIAISATRLVPTVLVMPHDSAVGWLNYSAREATIRFSEDIIPKLSCRSPGPFRARGDELASPRIASGAFVTLCSLAPERVIPF